MIRKKRLIGLSGKARSGKDTIGMYLVQSRGFHRMAFADPLKETMAAAFGIRVIEFHDDELKDKLHPLWAMTRRAMLQRGADALRGQFGQNFFIRRWLNSYLSICTHNNVVVTDVRSDAEAQAIINLGGVMLGVLRDNHQGLVGPESQHHTETGVSGHLIKAYLLNNGTLTELKALILQHLEDFPNAT